MASLKAEKPAGAQPAGTQPAGTQLPAQGKKEPVKASSTTPRTSAPKPAPKKTEQKPAPKKKASGGKTSAK